MLPILPSFDLKDSAPRDAVLCGNRGLRAPFLQKKADGSHVIFGKTRVGALLAPMSGDSFSVTHFAKRNVGVFDVFAHRAPFKVFGPVIGPDSVDMIHVCTGSNRLAMERLANNAMKANSAISVADFPRGVDVAIGITADQKAGGTADTPKGTRLISRASGNGFPDFIHSSCITTL